MIISDEDIICTLMHNIQNKKRIEFKFKPDKFEYYSDIILRNEKYKKLGGYYTFIYKPSGNHFFYFDKCFLHIFNPNKKSLIFDYDSTKFCCIDYNKHNFNKFHFKTLMI